MLLHSPTRLPERPNRIVSLVPSQTELLFHLQLGDRVKGITKFCIHPPEWQEEKFIVGGTKNIHLEKILACNPDLIIANKEENVKEQVEALAASCNVWVTDVNDLDGALQMICDIGELTQTQEKATTITTMIKKKFDNLHIAACPLKTTYLIWREPYMTIGGDTFIHDLLTRCGLTNMYAAKERYPVTSIDDIKKNGCELLLLSTEPYPFKQQHINELRLCLPNTKIMLVDGEFFSWYGSRLLQAADYFNQLVSAL